MVRAAGVDLSPGKVSIGVAAVADWATSLPILRRLLSPSEIARADRYRVEAKGVEFVVGRSTLRCALGRSLGIPPAVVEIDEGEGTKPRLGGALADRGIQFNVSHSGGRVALAIAKGRRVGIDLEEFRPVNHEERFAEMILSSGELRSYRAADASERLPWLLNRWTAKEAYLKGVGRGLAESLSTLEITVGPEGVDQVAPTHYDAASWTLHRLEAPAGFVLTLAAEQSETPLAIATFDAGEALAAACAGGVGAS